MLTHTINISYLVKILSYKTIQGDTEILCYRLYSTLRRRRARLWSYFDCSRCCRSPFHRRKTMKLGARYDGKVISKIYLARGIGDICTGQAM